jgi:hypothetical protein
MLEHEHQLVLRAVERAHAGIRLPPDAQVQKLGVDGAKRAHEFAEMAPVHADEVHGTVTGDTGERLGHVPQESGKGLRRHLARRHGELAVLDLTFTDGMAGYCYVIGRINKHGMGLFTSHEPGYRCAIPGIAAHHPVTLA